MNNMSILANQEVGRLLRLKYIDELPWLLNVIQEYVTLEEFQPVIEEYLK